LPADACIKILQANNIGPIFKWVDEFIIFRSPSTSLPLTGQHCYDYDLTSVTSITDPLGIPWHPISKKGQDFNLSNILASAGTCAQTVSLPEEKQDRVIQKLRHFLDTPHMSWKECASLHRSLQPSVLFVRMPAAPSLCYQPSYRNFPMMLYYTFFPTQSLMS